MISLSPRLTALYWALSDKSPLLHTLPFPWQSRRKSRSELSLEGLLQILTHTSNLAEAVFSISSVGHSLTIMPSLWHLNLTSLSLCSHSLTLAALLDKLTLTARRSAFRALEPSFAWPHRAFIDFMVRGSTSLQCTRVNCVCIQSSQYIEILEHCPELIRLALVDHIYGPTIQDDLLLALTLGGETATCAQN